MSYRAKPIPAFLVKYKKKSYLHCEWVSEELICEEKGGTQRCKRYHTKGGNDAHHFDLEMNDIYNPDYIKVDSMKTRYGG